LIMQRDFVGPAPHSVGGVKSFKDGHGGTTLGRSEVSDVG
jgi:hypothetical protein